MKSSFIYGHPLTWLIIKIIIVVKKYVNINNLNETT